MTYIVKFFVAVGVSTVILFMMSFFIINKISSTTDDVLLSKYDSIIILSGDPERAVLASELFNSKFANHILLSKEDKQINNFIYNEKIKTHLFYLKILKNSGVTRGDITLFGDNNTSTMEEILALSNISLNRNETFLVITNKYSIYRTKILIDRILPEYTMHLTYPREQYRNSKWWMEKNSIIAVFSEFMKLILLHTFGDFNNYLSYSKELD